MSAAQIRSLLDLVNNVANVATAVNNDTILLRTQVGNLQTVVTTSVAMVQADTAQVGNLQADANRLWSQMGNVSNVTAAVNGDTIRLRAQVGNLQTELTAVEARVGNVSNAVTADMAEMRAQLSDVRANVALIEKSSAATHVANLVPLDVFLSSMGESCTRAMAAVQGSQLEYIRSYFQATRPVEITISLDDGREMRVPTIALVSMRGIALDEVRIRSRARVYHGAGAVAMVDVAVPDASVAKPTSCMNRYWVMAIWACASMAAIRGALIRSAMGRFRRSDVMLILIFR